MADKTVKTNPQQDLDKLKAAQAAKLSQSFSGTSVLQFLKETRTELLKTTWPDKNTTQKSTYIVLAFIAAAAIWEGLIYAGMEKIMARLFNL
jgi:preprotein translocase SecE subunit